MKHVRFDVLDQEGGPVFRGLRPMTPWLAFDYWVLAPREKRPVEGIEIACEQGYVFTGGPVELTVRQQRIESGGGSGFIVEPTGFDHALKNLTNMFVHVLRVRVAMDMGSETQQRLVNRFWEQFGGSKRTRRKVCPSSRGPLTHKR